MSDTVQQIKDKLDIIDVISPYVELHKAGKNYKGKSPFTAEKTPSFFVSPDRGMYYCFSTSQGGDMFTFVQSMEGVDFKGALQILAQKAGVELVPEAPEKKTARDRSYAALQEATDFYKNWLSKNSSAQEYLKNRGVTELTIGKWQIGFAPGPPDHGWRMVKEHLESKGYTKEEILKVGLIKSTEGGKEPYDVFRDRVMFPMADSSGKVVAFSGRILSKDSEAPKYVNSPETEFYKKSELLYGYDKAKQGIRNLEFSLIVEGQFDVVMCHQAGYNNTVAVSGTALTPHHVQLLERLSDRVVLALDADKAGIAAMQRAADVMLRKGIDVKVAEMPLGKDPADIIKEDATEFKKIVGKSVHVIEFLLHVLKGQYKDERTLKLKAREEILPFVLLLPNRIDQEHFVGIIAKGIGSSSDAIRFELDRLREKARDGVTDQVEGERERAAVERAGDPIQSTRIFIEGALQIVNEKISENVEARYTELQKLAEEWSDLDEAEVAKTSFILEQQYNHASDLIIAEELAGKLNQLKQFLIKKRLAGAKELLGNIDPSSETEFTDTLKGVSDLEKELRGEAILPESLLK